MQSLSNKLNKIADNTNIYFGNKCNKSDGIDDPDVNSCHGQLSEWEFSYDGNDYKKVEYIRSNHISCLSCFFYYTNNS